MKSHHKVLTFSGSRFELRPYIVSDPAKLPAGQEDAGADVEPGPLEREAHFGLVVIIKSAWVVLVR